jgi:hypothetical protein
MTDHLDGNVLAGPIGELLDVEPTTVAGKCASCGDVAVLAQSLVYGGPMGLVARCRSCDNVLLVVVDAPGRALLAIPGLGWLRMER